MTVITGILYPLLVTGVCKVFFAEKARGSLISHNGKIAGSILIGQQFDSTVWFWPRPSAMDYNPLPSGGSNLSISNRHLQKSAMDRHDLFLIQNKLNDSIAVPSEMIYASASGIDPHISRRAAYLQVNRIAIARGFSKIQKEKLYKLIGMNTEPPQFHLFGEERVNVLMLNLTLDSIQ
jgi:K+-transporting ATPase ATPase C chain